VSPVEKEELAQHLARLARVIDQRTSLCRDGIDRLRELATNETEDEVYRVTVLLREAIELARCLRRLVPGRTVAEIHRAFGAPGDFGYEHPIGDALARVYGVIRSSDG